MTWTRVKDRDTGHEYSTEVVREDAHEVLEKEAADRFGNPLPPKHSRPLATLADGARKPISAMTKDELVAYAAANQIDLGEASLKPDILAAVQAHEQGDSNPAGGSGDTPPAA